MEDSVELHRQEGRKEKEKRESSIVILHLNTAILHLKVLEEFLVLLI